MWIYVFESEMGIRSNQNGPEGNSDERFGAEKRFSVIKMSNLNWIAEQKQQQSSFIPVLYQDGPSAPDRLSRDV